ELRPVSRYLDVGRLVDVVALGQPLGRVDPRHHDQWIAVVLAEADQALLGVPEAGVHRRDALRLGNVDATAVAGGERVAGQGGGVLGEAAQDLASGGVAI